MPEISGINDDFSHNFELSRVFDGLQTIDARVFKRETQVVLCKSRQYYG